MSMFTEKGRFFTGCNYWASHAGTRMWSDWNPEVVEEDFRRMHEAGLTLVRVFPLWPDFQPITLLRQGGGAPREYRFGEVPLPNTEAGRAGVSEEMLDRFAVMCGFARKYELSLLVGLVTGWMSGRFYAPQPLEHLNVLKDPEALRWESKFVHCFVRRFRDEPAIVAWDLGNECNCMGPLDNRSEAYVWAEYICGAIRSEDKTRPVVSGMHGLKIDGVWTMEDQGELTDVLTTHPYVLFVPHCAVDPIDTIRPGSHAASETLLYADVGHKPCFVEECGTLGPMFASEKIAAEYVRRNLYTLWAHDCKGFLWWCEADQKHLTHAPYDWNSVERELGLFRQNGEMKPVACVMKAFSDFMKTFPYLPLPPRMTDGVCVLTRGQDHWGSAFMSFVLARQAGLDIQYAWAEDEIPEAPLYILPNLCGDSSLSRRALQEILSRVEAGATLYMSVDSGLLCPFGEYTGLEPQTRSQTNGSETVRFGDDAFTLRRSFRLRNRAVTAQVLATDESGAPAYTVAEYGKGRVFFLAFPLEKQLLEEEGAFKPESAPYYRFYEALGRSPEKIARAAVRTTALTEHPLDENRRVIVAVSYADEAPSFTLADGWSVAETFGENVFLVRKD